jgi:hypothetical protein
MVKLFFFLIECLCLDWDIFFDLFKKKHKGKKRLLQMVNLVGDSCWDLQAMIEAKKEVKSKPKKVKQEAPPKAAPKKGKKSKTNSNNNATGFGGLLEPSNPFGGKLPTLDSELSTPSMIDHSMEEEEEEENEDPE